MSVFNASRLIGKTVLITGASGGIGAVRIYIFRSFQVACNIFSFFPGYGNSFRKSKRSQSPESTVSEGLT